MLQGYKPTIAVIGVGFIIPVGMGHLGQIPIVPRILIAGQGGACEPGGDCGAGATLDLDFGGVAPGIQGQMIPLPGPGLAVLGVAAGLCLDAIGIPIVYRTARRIGSPILPVVAGNIGVVGGGGKVRIDLGGSRGVPAQIVVGKGCRSAVGVGDAGGVVLASKIKNFAEGWRNTLYAPGI